MAKLVSKTYGEALFQTALDVKNVDGLYEEAEALQGILSENLELVKLFQHPNITKEEKLEVMRSVFEGRLSPEMTGLLQIVIEKGRQKELSGILAYFMEKIKEYKQIGIAYVTSASPLSKEQEKQIEEKLLDTTKYKSFEMHFSVDESLIGGLVIRIGDRVVDSSIKNRLYELKRELMKLQIG